jgi:hypothetical protein
MEPEISAYLKRVLNTISIGLLFLAVNSTLGIMYELAFFEDRIHWYNILFYVWLLASLFFLIRYYIKLWNKPLV